MPSDFVIDDIPDEPEDTLKTWIAEFEADKYSALFHLGFLKKQEWFSPLSSEKWERVTELCNHRIDSLEQLIEGKFPKELEVLFTDRKYGMFPSPEEIYFGCSCPDWASMCKHVAATLYGIGARLDINPMLFFELRDLDGQELIRKSMDQKLESMMKNAGKKSKREIPDKDISDIFGL